MSATLGLQVLVVSGSVLASVVPMAIVPALPEMARVLGEGATGSLIAQLVMAAPAISFACAAPLTAWLVSRYGRKPCLVVALVLFAVAGLLPCAVSETWMLVTSRTVLGVAGGIVSTLTLALAGDVPEDARNRLLGYSHAGGGGAAIGALLFGGLLVEIGGWRASFGLYALALPVLALALYSLPSMPARSRQQATEERGMPSKAGVIEGIGGFWLIYAMLFAMSVGFFVPPLEGPFLLVARSIDTPLAQGVCLSTMPVTSLVVSLFYGWARTRLNERGLSVVTLLSTGLGLCLAGAGESVWAMVLGFALVGVGAGLAVPVVAAILIDRTADDPGLRSSALGLYFTVMFGAQFATPLLIEPFKRQFGSAGAFICLGSLIAVSGFLTMSRASRAAIQGEA